MTGKRKITQGGYEPHGLCHSNGHLYVCDCKKEPEGSYKYSLAVYRVHSNRDITLLDRLTLFTDDQSWYLHPRVDCHSGRVFVPGRGQGVTVARLDGDRLVREKTLTCVREAISVDVMSPDTVYIGDRGRVHVVAVRDNRIMLTLEKPDPVDQYERPCRLAVLGNTVMVYYGNFTGALVVYSHGSPVPVREIPFPLGLENVSAISTDCRRHFLLAYYPTSSVFVIDASGNFCHTVNTDTHSHNTLIDCVVVNKQLWVGTMFGDIIIMSSQ